MKEMIADLHIHSRFSRATSKDLTINNLVKYAKIKGVDILGTGDFTHPSWFEEIKRELKEDKGILRTREGFPFVLSGEISLMYSQGKGRRIHLVMLAPSLEVVGQINSWLDTKGRRDYDGRPIFGFSCIDFMDAMNSISKEIEVIPGHAWTPFFGVFGSESGFDSLKEAFGDREKDIHAIESGMSSDPSMNWRIEELDSKAIVSFSDLHSFWPWRIGREATIFNLENNFGYSDMTKQIRENSIFGTIETDPGYGKYHYDGHRNCNFSCSPRETKELNGLCPVCKKNLTIGVENRIEKLASASRPAGFRSRNAKPFYKILPLHELIALMLDSKVESKKSWEVYNNMIGKFGNEMNILLKTEKEEMMREKIDAKLIELIMKNRIGNIRVRPGFDGQYGKPMLGESQARLF